MIEIRSFGKDVVIRALGSRIKSRATHSYLVMMMMRINLMMMH